MAKVDHDSDQGRTRCNSTPQWPLRSAGDDLPRYVESARDETSSLMKKRSGITGREAIINEYIHLPVDIYTWIPL